MVLSAFSINTLIGLFPTIISGPCLYLLTLISGRIYIPTHYLKINPFRMIPLCDMTYGHITTYIFFNNSKVNHQYLTDKIINV